MNMLKSHLDMDLGKFLHLALLEKGDGTIWPPEVPSNPNHSIIRDCIKYHSNWQNIKEEKLKNKEIIKTITLNKKTKENMPEQLEQQNLSGTFIENKYLIKQIGKNKNQKEDIRIHRSYLDNLWTTEN